jgi:hypothetical protein
MSPFEKTQILQWKIVIRCIDDIYYYKKSSKKQGHFLAILHQINDQISK